MSNPSESTQADEAKAALISDIKELKGAGRHAVSQAQSAVPWLVGGAAGLFAIGGFVALQPRRRSFAQRPSLLGSVVRAAALSAVGLLTRRLVNRACDKAWPAQQAGARELA